MDLKLYFRIQWKIYGNYFLISGNCMFLLPIIIAWPSILSFSSLFYTKIFVLYWHTVKHQSLYHLTYFEQSTRGVLWRFTVQENNCDRNFLKCRHRLKTWSLSEKRPYQSYFCVSLLTFFVIFQKKLLYTLFCLNFKIVESLQFILKDISHKTSVKHL